MCVCVCVCMYIHRLVHVHTHIHRYTETNVHRHTHIHVHIHVHIHRYIETVGVSKQRILDRLPQDESLLRRVVEDGEFALVHGLPAEIGEMLLRLLCHARDRSASSDGQTTLEYDSCRSWIANAEEVCACLVFTTVLVLGAGACGVMGGRLAPSGSTHALSRAQEYRRRVHQQAFDTLPVS